MSDKKSNIDIEELKRLEEEAYFELCQIIAEAIQVQDVNLLNSRIESWKAKYKKVLDNNIPNSSFKSKIKRLLDEDYQSELIAQILNQIKAKVQFKQSINQLKALRELYVTIKETDDLKTLKNKVEEWKSKYPTSDFLDMYKRRQGPGHLRHRGRRPRGGRRKPLLSEP